jgi:hypothetical protein
MADNEDRELENIIAQYSAGGDDEKQLDLDSEVTGTVGSPPVTPNFADLYVQIIKEIHLYESSLAAATESYTTALLNTGGMVNLDQLYNQLDMANTRLMRMLIVKRLCASLGLSEEYQLILNAEMELIYGKSAPGNGSGRPSIIAGEKR